MVGFSKKKKSSKRRGDREMGRGNAGKHKHKRVHYEKLGQQFGYTNFGFKRPDEAIEPVNAVNVSELETVLPRLVLMGEASKTGDVFTVDLTKMGIDKLLGSGQVRTKIKVTVETATASAKSKIEEAGGSIVAPAAPAA